jgi:Tfp pilus assembly protein PilW
MIIRPATDTELLELIAQIARDPALGLDTRAMLALLLASRDIKYFPFKDEVALALDASTGRPRGRFRLERMYREAQGAGYLARVTSGAPRTRRVPKYSFVAGDKQDVAKFIAMMHAYRGRADE